MGDWKEREGETERKRGCYQWRLGSAIDVHELGGVHAACLGMASVVMGDWTWGEGTRGHEVQKPGQGRGKDRGGGLAQRRAGLDTGGSGRDTETKPSGHWSGTQV